MTAEWSLLLFSILVNISAVAVSSFQPGKPHALLASTRSHDSYYSSKTYLYANTTGKYGKTKWGQKTDAEVSRFLTDFRTADGNVVDPYKMLRLSRDATAPEIKQSYRRLSRKLHPDMVAQNEVLPGRW